jgi:hypothetical protein
MSGSGEDLLMTAEELQQTLADIRAYRAAVNAKQIEAKPVDE